MALTISQAMKTERIFPALSVTMYTDNTDVSIFCPVAIRPAAIMEAPPPDAPPKKKTVMGVAVMVPTSPRTMPETISFHTLVIMLYLARRPAASPMKKAQIA